MAAMLLALMLASQPLSPGPAQPPSPQSPQTPSAGQGGQTAAPAPPAPAPQGQAPPQPEAFTYQPSGRRDPFLSLVGTGKEPGSASRRSDGPSGMTLAEVSVRGIMQSKGTLVAMIQGPDNKTYIVHQGDKLLDGVIKTVTPQGIVVVQEVNDPLSLVKQREVRKLLKGLEDAK